MTQKRVLRRPSKEEYEAAYADSLSTTEASVRHFLEHFPTRKARDRALLIMEVWSSLPKAQASLFMTADGYEARYLQRRISEADPSFKSLAFFSASFRLLRAERRYKGKINLTPVWAYLDTPGAVYSRAINALTAVTKVSEDQTEEVLLKQLQESPPKVKSAPAPVPVAKASPRKAPEVPEKSESKEEADEAKKVWQDLRDSFEAQLRPFLQGRLQGIEEEDEIEERLRDALIDIQSAFKNMLLGVRQVRRGTLLDKHRMGVTRAFGTLGIDIREWRKINDEKAAKTQIKKAYWSLSSRFHPDKNSGSSIHQQQYDDVQKAFAVLKVRFDI